MKPELENLIKDLVTLATDYYNEGKTIYAYPIRWYKDTSLNDVYWSITFSKEHIVITHYDNASKPSIACDYTMITIPKLTKLITKYRNQLNKLKSKKNDRTK